ncbi:hypothetical protein TVAGG3_0926670 [Trichomonas vaginalis G3]|uniref:hypothetical protein n=1 Tax=Trichomonas vaginalis (strain ATCC PRA-98 / G3) TaxID=412133 RepID=UPI0021E56B56|nr:hypothetical protein TVAGG3_0926670 [Trichomonas vaginalis G3]KAI5485530.1 hypothetical protein TVAGG3_0926670 [Trichomonas vaginalis G3]
MTNTCELNTTYDYDEVFVPKEVETIVYDIEGVPESEYRITKRTVMMPLYNPDDRSLITSVIVDKRPNETDTSQNPTQTVEPEKKIYEDKIPKTQL